MLHILSYIVFFVTYAFFTKIREAHYYDLFYRLASTHKDLHSTYLKERMSILGLYLLSMINDVNWWSILMLCWFSIFAWDFFGDGFYYMFRNKLNKRIYKEGFKATESNTSTAITDKKGYTKTYKDRVIYLIFAVGFLLTALIIQFFSK